MKIYNKIGFVALSVTLLASCAKHDLIGDNVELGQVLPTVSWELESNVCKAGTEAVFKGQYYTDKDHQIDHAEVWAATTRTESAAATCKLTTALAYTKTVASNDTVRRSQLIASYKHEQAVWDGYEYVLTASFPTSQTLSPVAWVNPNTWDNEKFESYYPANFREEFVSTVVEFLTKDSAYYGDLRNVYINFDFKAEQFDALNQKYGFDIPNETDAGKKSDLWYTNTENVVGKYYTTVDGAGNTIVHEVPLDFVGEVKLYDVYESSKWIFCRYSDDTGGVMTSVRSQYMPYWKELISMITFPEWIYNTAEQTYAVSFSRDYKLIPTFRVYDNKGKYGTDTDEKEIVLN